MNKLFFSLLLCVVCMFHVQAQTQELDQLSLSISKELQSLKNETSTLKNDLLNMTESLQAQSNLLKLSESELEMWKARSIGLSDSLKNINDSLNKSFETIAIYRHKLVHRMKVITVLMTIIVLMIIAKIIGYVLYAKGIKLPRWLDILM